MNMLSIDPGSSGGAVALWGEDKVPKYVCLWEPHKNDIHASMVRKYPGGEHWVNRCLAMAVWIAAHVPAHNIEQVYCEEPKHMDEGMTARGSLVKLSFNVGAIAQAVTTRGAQFSLVPVMRWMGQMDDTAIQHRVRKRLGNDLCDRMNFRSHIWDAVGIGLHVKGLW